MPLIEINIYRTGSQLDTKSIVNSAIDETVNILGKDRAVTAVVLNNFSNCFPNELSGNYTTDYSVKIFITEGTNTKEDKAIWISTINKLMKDSLDIPSGGYANYVSIIELDSKNWGYDGKTQSDRKDNKSKDFN
ncbi:hypothetical protein A9G07_07245 [Gilliamella sp. wkB72]|uniref:tautomerase family protein n=1 Tax=Gilliamella sp. wkB72 TaxID=3120265 RepID=UPI000810D06A|nr:hypothetical protein [Gilliamella apicola]OCL22855.1 hypothetical protein A9G07_07245 [Gilliamella apicola]